MYKKVNEQRIINIGRDLIVVNKIGGAEGLHRILINSKFAGYIEKRAGEYYRLDGHDIHNLIFARLCQIMG
ncbi:hypothetical protein [Pedobacter aquatilis]|uniref:hypothetical protein n=1 Tax=Pedobacter aquatilis TaxID=351343 RepID=UPI00292D4481|nr:hypothetical protein [Pedobacter aquatilis]